MMSEQAEVDLEVEAYYRSRIPQEERLPKRDLVFSHGRHVVAHTWRWVPNPECKVCASMFAPYRRADGVLMTTCCPECVDAVFGAIPAEVAT